MNAIEMAVTALLEKHGPAMLEKLLGTIPPEVLQNIGQIGQMALSLKGQLDRIENQQRLILAHLNVSATEQSGRIVRDTQPLEISHERRNDEQQRDGQAE